MRRWKLFLDDLREVESIYPYPASKEFLVARSVPEAVSLIEIHGMPVFVSFDHDLGLDENGSCALSGDDFAKILIEWDLDNRFMMDREFSFKVHSSNPVGARNILERLNRYLRFRSCQAEQRGEQSISWVG